MARPILQIRKEAAKREAEEAFARGAEVAPGRLARSTYAADTPHNSIFYPHQITHKQGRFL